MGTSPFTKLRAEDQISGHRLDLGGSYGSGPAGTLVLHESAPGLHDATLLLEGPLAVASDLTLGGAGVAGTLLVNESALGANDGSLDVKGNANITGDLDVLGNITFHTLIIKFKDPNLTLNDGGTDATADGGGLTIDRTTSPKPSIVWKNDLDAWACGVVGAEKEITNQGNDFNDAGQLTLLDSNRKVPLYSTQNYTHDQPTPSDTWNIPHGMNKRPSVVVVTSAGDVVYGNIAYVDDNNVVVTFAASFSGKAYLN